MSVLNTEERAQLDAICTCFLPAGPDGPSAREAHVVEYIEGQLAAPWGQGARMYRQGPFASDPLPESGWQSPMTPFEAYRHGLAALEQHAQTTHGSRLEALSEEQMSALMLDWSEGRVPAFTEIDGAVFFGMVSQNVAEGLFSDPCYGGNHDMVGWRWLGYPGVANVQEVPYTELIGTGEPYVVEPRSLDWTPSERS